MHSVKEHYENLLADHYTWMCGDFDEKLRLNVEFFRDLDIAPSAHGKAIDLGCGPGFQSIALARLGYEVTAVDTSQLLLDELCDHKAELPITTVRADILDDESYIENGPYELAVCMGDTLVHLQTEAEVQLLLQKVAANLLPEGRFVITYRDLSMELNGIDRAIPVRMSDEKIMVTFLEYADTQVNVHDMVVLREEDQWKMLKSAYSKLRLSIATLETLLKTTGFTTMSSEVASGFRKVVAKKL